MKLNRRQLLQLAAASAISQQSWGAINTSPAITGMPTDDYKAIVCVFLLGGNDSWNLLVPTADEQKTGQGKGYQTYNKRRADIAVKQTPLDLPLTNGKLAIATAGDNPYLAPNKIANNAASYLKGVYPIDNHNWGINGCAPELADLWHNNQLAWTVNTGVLAQPITRSSLTSIQKPLFLFAHNHQQRELASADALQKHKNGWAGRLADHWQVGQKGGINNQHLFGLNIAIGGSSPIIAAANAPELVLPVGKPLTMAGMSANNPQAQHMAEAWNQLLNVERRGLWQGLLSERNQNAYKLSAMLSERWNSTNKYTDTSGSYGEPLFELPEQGILGLEQNISSQLTKKLETVARLIEIGKQDGIKRQVFVVTLGGFDTHANQADKHPLLIRELSIALGKFQKAMDAQQLAEQVTLFTQSDFGRTLSPNATGTDHAWGGNQLVMGGAVKSQVIGQMPDLGETSEDMVPDPRGRIIPTLAAEQTTAALLQWFGLDQQSITEVLPQLSYFDGPLPLFKT